MKRAAEEKEEEEEEEVRSDMLVQAFKFPSIFRKTIVFQLDLVAMMGLLF